MRLSYILSYMVGGLLIVVGMMQGTIVKGGRHLLVEGEAVTLLKFGATLVIVGWFIELVEIIRRT